MTYKHIGLAMLLLSACVETAVLPVEPPGTATCGANGLQSLIGQDAAVLETMRFSQTVRIIRPDTMVTMDYSAERLNIRVNGAEKIDAVTCG